MYELLLKFVGNVTYTFTQKKNRNVDNIPCPLLGADLLVM